MQKGLIPIMLPPDPIVADFLESKGYLEAAMCLRGTPPSKNRKILISQEGWTSHNHHLSWEEREFLLTYPPFIKAVEEGEVFPSEPDDWGFESWNFLEFCSTPLAKKFKEDYKKIFGTPKEEMFFENLFWHVYGLKVVEVCGPVRIQNYLGNEWVEELYEVAWY